jgi:hypothetical protein
MLGAARRVGSPTDSAAFRRRRWVSLNARSWVGFRELVVLLDSKPDAAARLTPAARQEVARLLRVGG